MLAMSRSPAGSNALAFFSECLDGAGGICSEMLSFLHDGEIETVVPYGHQNDDPWAGFCITTREADIWVEQFIKTELQSNFVFGQDLYLHEASCCRFDVGNTVFYQDLVYRTVGRQSDLGGIRYFLRSFAMFTRAIMVAKLDKSFDFTVRPLPEARSISSVLISAFDQCGYVVWTKNI